MAQTIAAGPNALPPPRWFGLPLTTFLVLTTGATAGLIIFGALAPVLGAFVGGVLPAFGIQRARLIRIPFLLTLLGALIGATVAGFVWVPRSIIAIVVLSAAAGAMVGLALAMSGVALWLRARARRASA